MSDFSNLSYNQHIKPEYTRLNPEYYIQSNTFNSYHPNDFLHFLLALHCDQEILEKNERIYCSNEVNRIFNTITNNKFKDYLKAWRVFDFVEYQSSIIGSSTRKKIIAVIYTNDKTFQLVVAYKNNRLAQELFTNFETFFTNLMHEKYSFCQLKSYALSFTGYSIGALLAQLSVFYCNKGIKINNKLEKYFNVKAITFDAPNIYEYLVELSMRSNPFSSLDELDLITYISVSSSDIKWFGQIILCSNCEQGDQNITLLSFVNNFDQNTGKTKQTNNFIERSITDKIDQFIASLFNNETKERKKNEIFEHIIETCELVKNKLILKIKLGYHGKTDMNEIRDKFRGIIFIKHKNSYENFDEEFQKRNVIKNQHSVSRKYSDYSINEEILSDYLKDLKMAFHSNKAVVLKSFLIEVVHTLAIEYTVRSKNDFTSFVLNASDKNELFRSFDSITNQKNSFETFKVSLVHGCHKVIFILDNVLNYSHIREFINSFASLSTVKFIITTRNDYLVIDEIYFQNLQEISFDYIEQKDRNLVDMNLKILKRTNNFAWNALQILAFIKENQIYSNLMNKNLKEAAVLLPTQSFIKINKNKLILNHLIAELTINLLDAKTGLEFFKLISQIDSNHMDVRRALEKLFLYDESEFEKQSKSINFDPIDDNLLNMIEILNAFRQDENLRPSQDERENLKIQRIKKAFKNLKDAIERQNNKMLQEALNKLLANWKNQVTIGSYENEIRKILNDLNRFILRLKNIEINSSGNDYLKNVLLVGPTKNGKSTLISLLIGNKLSCNKYNSLTGPEIVPRTEDEETPEIGNERNSKTSSINEYLDKIQHIRYWDSPGLYDTGGTLHEIFNGFNLQFFNNHIKYNKNFSILLAISADKFKPPAENFIDCLKKLSEMLSIDEIQDKICLIITKHTDVDKESYVEFFESLLQENYNDILKIFTNPDKIAFTECINKVGSINNEEYCSDVKNIVSNQLNFGEFNFKINVSDKARVDIISLVRIFNSYAQFLTGQVKIKINNSFKNDLCNYEGDLKKKIEERFNIKCENTLDKLGDKELIIYLDRALRDENTIKVIKSIIGCFSFFRQVDSTFQNDLLPLSLSIQELFGTYKEFSRKIIRDKLYHSNENIVLKAPIVFLSEINEMIENEEINLNNLHSVTIMAYLFVVDIDLYLPGVDLNIFSCIWRTNGQRTLSLKGADGKNNGECGYPGGNFYGVCKNKLIANESMLTIDVSGGKGGDFGNEKLIDLEKEEKKKEILREKYDKILFEYKKHQLNDIDIGDLEKERDEYINKRELNLEELKHWKNFQNTCTITKLEIERQIDHAQEREKKFSMGLLERKNKINYRKLFSCIENFKNLSLQIEEKKKLLEAYKISVDDYNEQINEINRKLENVQQLDENFETIQQNIESELKKIQENLKILKENDPKKQSNLRQQIIKLEKDFEKEKQKLDLKLEVISYKEMIMNDKNISFDFKNLIFEDLSACQLKIRQEELYLEIKQLKENNLNFKDMRDYFKDFIDAHNTCVDLENQLNNARKNFKDLFSKLDETKLKSEDRSNISLLREIRELGDQNHIDLEKLNSTMLNNDITIAFSKDILNKPQNNNLDEMNEKKTLIGCNKIEEFYSNSEVYCREKKRQLEVVKKKIQKMLKSVKPNFLPNIREYLIQNNKNLILELKSFIDKMKNIETKLEKEVTPTPKVKKSFIKDINMLLNLYDNKKSYPTIEERIKYLIKILDLIENDNVVQIINERIERLEFFKETLVDAYKNYSDSKRKFDNKKKLLKKMNKKKANDSLIKNLINAYLLIERLCNENSNALINEAELAKNLLRNEIFMKNKIKIDSMFKNSYLEQYEFVGTHGGEGGDSGNYKFETPLKEFIQAIQKGGEGGENSLRLVGNYYTEHCFVSLKSINEKNRIESLDDEETNIFFTGFINFLGFFIKPIKALLSDRWYDGPYKIEFARAKRGQDKKEMIEINQEKNDLVKLFSNYMEEITPIVRIISQDNKSK